MVGCRWLGDIHLELSLFDNLIDLDEVLRVEDIIIIISIVVVVVNIDIIVRAVLNRRCFWIREHMIREEEEGRITTDDECMMIDFFFLFAYRGRDGGLGDGEFGGADGGYLIVFFFFTRYCIFLSPPFSPSYLLFDHCFHGEEIVLSIRCRCRCRIFGTVLLLGTELTSQTRPNDRPSRLITFFIDDVFHCKPHNLGYKLTYNSFP